MPSLCSRNICRFVMKSSDCHKVSMTSVIPCHSLSELVLCSWRNLGVVAFFLTTEFHQEAELRIDTNSSDDTNCLVFNEVDELIEMPPTTHLQLFTTKSDKSSSRRFAKPRKHSTKTEAERQPLFLRSSCPTLLWI